MGAEAEKLTRRRGDTEVQKEISHKDAQDAQKEKATEKEKVCTFCVVCVVCGFCWNHGIHGIHGREGAATGVFYIFVPNYPVSASICGFFLGVLGGSIQSVSIRVHPWFFCCFVAKYSSCGMTLNRNNHISNQTVY
jgi:hypothetical protein